MGAVWIVFWCTVLAAFLVIEFGSIIYERCSTRTWRGAAHLTFSEFVRRWSAAHHWLPTLVVGLTAALMVHLFWNP